MQFRGCGLRGLSPKININAIFRVPDVTGKRGGLL